MKRHMSIGIALAILFLSVLPALAYATDYNAQDPQRNIDSWTSCAYLDWVDNGYAMTWKAADSTLATRVYNAFEAWRTSANTKLTHTQVINGQDVYFYYGTPPSGGVGENLENYVWDSVRQAYYWTTGTVIVSNQVCWEENGYKTVLRHEIGHLYGLGEQYLAGGACNPNVISIMDGPTVNPQTGCYNGGCDGTAIQLKDKTLVNAFWGQGEPKNLNAVPSGTRATVTWDDYSWAENGYEVKIYYKNGSTWQLVTTQCVTSLTGVHDTIMNRTIEYAFDRTAYGKPSGTYKADVKPYFMKYNQYGTLRSKQFTLQ